MLFSTLFSIQQENANFSEDITRSRCCTCDQGIQLQAEQ